MRKDLIGLVILIGSLAMSQLAQAGEPPFSEQAPAASSRVVTVKSPGATKAFLAVPEKLPAMIERGLLRLTGKKTKRDAWRTLVNSNDVVGIKVYSAPGAQSGTRPAVVAALVENLIAAGHPAERIIVWDKSLTHLRLAGYSDFADRYRIRVLGAAQVGFDETVFYENPVIGELVWGDLDFGKKGEGLGRKSYLSKVVTKEITKIINVSPLLNHNHAGITGNLYSLSLGSIDNWNRFEHNADRLATSVPEIYALPTLSDRVVLNICDALICQYEGEQRSLVHYSVPLDQLRFSKDPVALDVLGIASIEEQRKLSGTGAAAKPNRELYDNAALLELGHTDKKKIVIERVKVR